MMYYMEEPSPSSSSSSSPSSSSSSSWGYGGYPYSSYYIGVVQGDPHPRPHPLEKVGRVVAESAVVIFSKSGCCMCHAVKRLLCGMGVNPRVYEIDQDPSGNDIEEALIRLIGNYNNNNNSTSLSSPVPVVFIGGKLVGAMDRVMASHINGSLVPLLKEAGALWL